MSPLGSASTLRQASTTVTANTTQEIAKAIRDEARTNGTVRRVRPCSLLAFYSGSSSSWPVNGWSVTNRSVSA